MAEAGGPYTIPEGHIALISRVAEAWSQLEVKVDRGIWHLAATPVRCARAIRLFAVLFMGMFVVGCDGPTYTYRYRLTLIVESDGQLHTGTSVVEVSEWRTSEWRLEPHLVKTKVVGEATLVDLGRGRVLVALLDGISEGTPERDRGGREWIGRTPTGLLVRLFGLHYRWDGTRNEGLAELVRHRGVRDLNSNQLPVLVTFKDVSDPKTISVVDPNNLIPSLGSHTAIKSATIELADAAVTTRIEGKLPWLKAVGGKYIDGASTARNSVGFHGGQFRRRG